MPKMRSVLIVEDDNDIREIMVELVAHHGYEPRAARGGQEALDLLNNGQCDEPCLILLDWALPLMSGKEFLEMRRATDVIVPIPVIIISGTPPGALPLGATKILRKPFDMESLFKDIDEYCDEAMIEKVVKTAVVVGKKAS